MPHHVTVAPPVVRTRTGAGVPIVDDHGLIQPTGLALTRRRMAYVPRPPTSTPGANVRFVTFTLTFTSAMPPCGVSGQVQEYGTVTAIGSSGGLSTRGRGAVGGFGVVG